MCIFIYGAYFYGANFTQVYTSAYVEIDFIGKFNHTYHNCPEYSTDGYNSNAVSDWLDLFGTVLKIWLNILEHMEYVTDNRTP